MGILKQSHEQPTTNHIAPIQKSVSKESLIAGKLL